MPHNFTENYGEMSIVDYVGYEFYKFSNVYHERKTKSKWVTAILKQLNKKDIIFWPRGVYIRCILFVSLSLSFSFHNFYYRHTMVRLLLFNMFICLSVCTDIRGVKTRLIYQCFMINFSPSSIIYCTVFNFLRNLPNFGNKSLFLRLTCIFLQKSILAGSNEPFYKLVIFDIKTFSVRNIQVIPLFWNWGLPKLLVLNVFTQGFIVPLVLFSFYQVFALKLCSLFGDILRWISRRCNFRLKYV